MINIALSESWVLFYCKQNKLKNIKKQRFFQKAKKAKKAKGFLEKQKKQKKLLVSVSVLYVSVNC